MLIVAAWGFFYSRRSGKLTEKDSILLSDFINTTGDSVFDGTLKQALAVQLETFHYLNIFPHSPIPETPRLQGPSPG